MQRREFICLAAALPGIGLTPVRAVAADSTMLPLIRLIEETPREALTAKITALIRAGLARHELLKAIQLAGLRQIEPRPVGFKFHAVMMVDAVRRLSLGDAGSNGWIPILWNLDYFKFSQARSYRQSDWRLGEFRSVAAPVGQAERLYLDAMQFRQWSLAEQAIVALARSRGRNYLLALLSELAVRDFHSIGHKAIYISHCWRLLRDASQAELELMLRAMSYALLARDSQQSEKPAEPNARLPWQEVNYPLNLQRLAVIPLQACMAVPDRALTEQLLLRIGQGDADDCCDFATRLLIQGASFQMVWDALFLAAAEAVMNRPSIPLLHTVTVSHSMYWLWQQASEQRLRRLIPLQALAYVVQMRRHFKVPESGVPILSLQELAAHKADKAELAGGLESRIRQIGEVLGTDPALARQRLAAFPVQQYWPQLRRSLNDWLLLKSDQAHDFKYGAAVLESLPWLSPPYQAAYLAAASLLLPGINRKNSREADQLSSWLES